MRPTASIVIPAWNEWAATKGCLETLRPTLGMRDEVIVVDNGSTDETAAGLRRYPWVRVVSHADNLGFAAGCNSGAAVAVGDVVVFLNNDTLLPARWLDGLLAPFDDATIGATGPRSDFVSGPQIVPDVPYAHGRVADLQRFARQWRADHRGQTTDVDRLVGFCLAVRRDLFEELGGFDETFGLGGCEDDDLCLRILDAGRRLVIAHESFVHHHGHRTFNANGVDWFALQTRNTSVLRDKHARSSVSRPTEVLLSACLIVKDEEERLARCLASLSGLADEVVVYDTGSSDRTRDIARSAGATVIEGHWDDDFSRARNDALALCGGRWVLSIDADEVVEGDTPGLRHELTRNGTVDCLDVLIDNTDSQDEVIQSHHAVRLFQRARARWEGRLHEQLVPVFGPLVLGGTTKITLRHSGYTPEAVAAGRKAERNLRLALADQQDRGAQDVRSALNVAKSLTLAGRVDEALDHYDRVRRAATEPADLRCALRDGARLLLSVGRAAEALIWAQELRGHTHYPAMADYLEGLARMDLGDNVGALELFSRTDGAHDEEYAVPTHEVHLHRGLMLYALERWDEAVGELLVGAKDRRVTDVVWVPLVESCWRAGRGMRSVAELAADRLLVVLGKATKADPAAADALAEELWRTQQGGSVLLAFIGQVAIHLPLLRGLEWSARLRAAGLEHACPLVRTAGDTDADPLVRLRAGAVAYETFSDVRAGAAVRAAAADVFPRDFSAALLTLDELSPQLLQTFVTGAASDPARAGRLAGVLRTLGAGEAADALLAPA